MGQKTEVSTTSVEPAAAATQSKPEDGPPIATQNDVVVADEEDLQLGDEQKHVLERALAGESIFFTGPAGVGKSELLKAIIRAMRTKHTHPNHCAVTASVGIAAANIGGTTLHSWAGLGLAKKPVDALYKQLIFSYRRQDTIARWRNCRVLIIDEGDCLVTQSLFDS